MNLKNLNLKCHVLYQIYGCILEMILKFNCIFLRTEINIVSFECNRFKFIPYFDNFWVIFSTYLKKVLKFRR